VAVERRTVAWEGAHPPQRLSQRRFIELFSAEVGMTPKLYARVRRFQRAVALARMSPSPDWCALARHFGDRVKENHLALPGVGSNFSKTRSTAGRNY
jgi:hypothetical protein